MSEDTTLRDELARDRTVLANERTLLAYGRTAVALVALAVFVFRFSPTPMGIAIGVFSLIGASGVMLLGWRNYRSISNRISNSPDGGHRDLDE
jgi:putative membrane protein